MGFADKTVEHMDYVDRSTKRLRRLTFAKRSRLVKNSQFKAVLEQRKRVSDGLLAMYVASNGGDYTRLGISIGRACGSAVVRNRFKRLIREAFRLEQERWPVGLDVVVMVNAHWQAMFTSVETQQRAWPDLVSIQRSLSGLMARIKQRRWCTYTPLEDGSDD